MRFDNPRNSPLRACLEAGAPPARGRHNGMAASTGSPQRIGRLVEGLYLQSFRGKLQGGSFRGQIERAGFEFPLARAHSGRQEQDGFVNLKTAVDAISSPLSALL